MKINDESNRGTAQKAVSSTQKCLKFIDFMFLSRVKLFAVYAHDSATDVKSLVRRKLRVINFPLPCCVNGSPEFWPFDKITMIELEKNK